MKITEEKYFKSTIQNTKNASLGRRQLVDDLKKTFLLNWAFLLPMIEGKKVLDIGCGTGSFLDVYKELGAQETVGIDRSIDCIEAAKSQSLHQHGLVHANAADYLQSTKDQFDFISAFHVIEHMDRVDADHLMGAVKRRLKKEGSWLIETPNMQYPMASYHLWGDPTHLIGYTPGALASAAASHDFMTIQEGAKLNPAKNIVTHVRMKMTAIGLNYVYPFMIGLLEGPTELKGRRKIFSPYFWSVFGTRSDAAGKPTPN